MSLEFGGDISHCHLPLYFFKRHDYFIFRAKGREREREEEKHRCEREIPIRCLSWAPCPGTKHETQACALTGN